MREYTYQELSVGQTFDFGTITLTEEQIIAFAKVFDPIPFHIDVEYAKKSHFGGIIASGSQLFHEFYKREWVPRFQYTVYAGMGVENWALKKPLYANVEVRCKVSIATKVDKPERGFGIIKWQFVFEGTADKSLYQTMDLTVTHKLEC